MASYQATEPIDIGFGVIPEDTTSESSSNIEDKPINGTLEEPIQSMPDESTEESIAESIKEQLSTPDLLSTYKGGAYYTPMYTSEGFYTPWGKASFEQGDSYIRSTVFGLSLFFLIIFAIPFVVNSVSNILSRIQKTIEK